MWTFLLCLTFFYVGTGLVVGRIDAKHRGVEFEIDWVEVLKWPKELF